MDGIIVDKALVKKYLQGQAGADEERAVKRYLQQPGAQQLFDEVWLEMDADMVGPAQSGLSERRDLRLLNWKEKMLKRIAEEDMPALPQKQKFNIYRYAAIWLLVALGIAGYGIYHLTKQAPARVAMLETRNPNGTRRMILLADSSMVWLGPGSTLRYPEKFSGDTREIALSGEAFFEVTKNPERPFIIHTGDVQTKVLGTSFKIEAFKNYPLIVSVSTGKVRVDRHVHGKASSLAVLTPGLQVTWDPKTLLAHTGTVNINDVSGWRNGKLVFNETSLPEIARVLERWYNVRISIRNQRLKNMHIKITLMNNLPVQEVIKVLAATGHFHYRIENRSLTLTP